VDANNQPWLVLGDSSQTIMANLTPSQMATYFAQRKSQGFTSSWQWFFYPGSSPASADGTPAFTATINGYPDLTTPNEAFWKQVDAMINTAAANGITIFLNESYGTPPEQLFQQVAIANGTSRVQSFRTFVGNRYKSFPNIVWFFGNDYYGLPGSVEQNLLLTYIDAVRAADPNHIHTIELGGSETSLDNSDMSSRIELNLAYCYHDYACAYSLIYQGYNQSTMPVFAGEGWYDGEGASPLGLRQQAYYPVLAGGAGSLYGNTDWSGFSNWATDWNDTGATQYAISGTFFRGYAWYNLVPDQSHSIVTAGYGSGTGYVTTARVPDGSLIISYLPVSSTITVDMTKMRGTATAKWFDPTSSRYTSSGSIANTGTHAFTSPGNHGDGTDDWVLVLTNP
jgi:hypothetical protein